MDFYFKSDSIYIILCTIVFLYIVADHYLFKKSKSAPPGPLGLPLCGSLLLFLTTRTHREMEDMSRKYGDVFSMYLGPHRTVIVSSYEIAKEVLNSPVFLTRSPIVPLDFLEGGLGIVAQSGSAWHEQKNFSMRVLRELGVGKSPVEQCIQDEVMAIIGVIDKYNGRLNPIQIENELMSSVSNVVTTLAFGRSLAHDDPKRQVLNKVVHAIFHSWHALSIVPLVGPIYRLYKKYLDPFAYSHLYNFSRNEIKKHKLALKSGEPTFNSYISQYLNLLEAKTTENEMSSFSEEALIGNIQALFLAGTETTKTALHWSLIAMAAYPHIQAKVHREIDNNLDENQLPRWEDRKILPYVQCVLQEIHRWRTILPFGIFRYSTENSTFRGYVIPKNTTVIIHQHGVHRDPKLWEDPDEFNPGRHLSEDGKSMVKRDGIIPFSSGKRTCPGEGLANMELFIFFTSLLQKYIVSPVDGEIIDIKDYYHNVIRPKPQHLKFIMR